MKETNQRRRSKAERNQKSVERLQKSSSRILGKTQTISKPFENLNNTPININVV
jgi:hypothetical protein